MTSNWSYSPETAKLGHDLCDLDRWPFAWTLLLSLVITPENFVMIRWWEHSQKGMTDKRTDRQTDRRTDWTIHRAAWSQLKISYFHFPHMDGLVQERCNSSALGMELLLSCTNPSICPRLKWYACIFKIELFLLKETWPSFIYSVHLCSFIPTQHP